MKWLLAIALFLVTACGDERPSKPTQKCKVTETAEQVTLNCGGTITVIPKGKDGKDGKDGTDGIAGNDGADGTNGVNGTDGVDGTNGVDGQDGADFVPTAPTVNQQIQSVVDQENANRTFAGQNQLSPGLSCTVNKFGSVASPQYPSSIADSVSGANYNRYAFSYTLKSSINQPSTPVTNGLNIFPTAVRSNPDYQTWYRVTCQGYVVVTETNYYNFSITSDDGAILQVDGLTLNGDGNHSSTTKTGSVALQKGVRYLKVDYMQAAGTQELILKMNGSVLSADRFYF